MIIGISGKKGHGKDTVADIIEEHTILEWDRKRFADSLKDMVCILLKCTREQLEDPDYKEKPLGKEWDKYETSYTYKNFNKKVQLTPRKILQLLGTEGGRQLIHPNIWVNSLFEEYHNMIDPNSAGVIRPYWLVTDVRFPNEANAILEHGGTLIRIEREGMDESDQHLSETALDNYKYFDHIIYNDGTLADLEVKVIDVLKHCI